MQFHTAVRWATPMAQKSQGLAALEWPVHATHPPQPQVGYKKVFQEEVLEGHGFLPVIGGTQGSDTAVRGAARQQAGGVNAAACLRQIEP